MLGQRYLYGRGTELISELCKTGWNPCVKQTNCQVGIKPHYYIHVYTLWIIRLNRLGYDRTAANKCVLNSVDKKPHFVISRPRDDQVCTKYYISKQNCKSDELNEHSHSRIKFKKNNYFTNNSTHIHGIGVH